MWTLQNLDRDDFLANYWQKKPLLIRQALPGFESVISPEELAGLAMEPGVHSRLVIEKDAEQPWQLSYGPFDEERFTSLPPSHYSLLVSECEKWIPELRELLDQFTFIPRWRIDDLMISYAPDQGSVGPHIDEYDVFLIQAQGRREWMIESGARECPELIEGLDLAILREFDPDQRWVLEPGDLLYLPPKIPHHGVALGDGCMNYSVGFRAPSVGDVMDSFLLEAGDRGLTDRRYGDPDLLTPRDPAEIIEQDLQGFRMLVAQLLNDSKPLWPDIIGKLVSDATLSEDIPGIELADLEEAAGFDWQAHPDSRFAFHESDGRLTLYANGKAFALPANLAHRKLISRLCNQHRFDFADLLPGLSADWDACLLELINQRALIPLDEETDDG